MEKIGHKRIKIQHPCGGQSELIFKPFEGAGTEFVRGYKDYIWWWDDERACWLFSLDVKDYLNELWC